MKNSTGLCSSSCVYRALGVLILGIVFTKPLSAQAVYGNVVGIVVGASGEGISGAAITVTSLEKGTNQRTTSTSSGLFTVTHLLSDTYNIKAEAPGYAAVEFPGQEVYADQAVSIELHLKRGLATGAIQRAEESLPLKTDRADVSTTLSLREVEDLPNFQRNFTNFELLAPGALPNATQVAVLRPEQNPQQGLQINQNGQHFSGSAFQLDGTDNRDPLAGVIVINPSLQSISEMKITSQNFDAEFGQALAGLVTAQTRSGSNRWHASAFEIRASDWGEASAPYLNNPNAATYPFKTNEFGGSLGGPLVKNRLFVFGDYQGHRRAFDITKLVAVPTLRARNTCLGLDTTEGPVCDLSDYPVKIYQPANFPMPGTQFGALGSVCMKNCIPSGMLSPQALNLLNLIPAPNTPLSDNASTSELSVPYNYEATGAEPWNDDEFDVRLDHAVSDKVKLFGRYSFADFRINADGVFGSIVGGLGLSTDGFAGTSRSRNQSISSGFDYTFNPTLNMDFRFGFYRYRLSVFQNGLNTRPATDAGINGLNLGDTFSSGMPAFTTVDRVKSVGGDLVFGYGLQDGCPTCPLLEREYQFQWATNWSKIRGSHGVKWGADFRYARNLRLSGNRAGALSFESLNTQNPNRKPGDAPSGLGLATFLLGNVTSFSRFYGKDFDAEERQNRLFFYGQDNWRVTSKLALTYGLRWEVYAPQSVSSPGQGGFLDLNTGLMDVAGFGNFNLQGNVQNSFTNFAPRVGLAYQILPRTVIRAAYGRSFDLGFAGAVFGDTVTQNLPVVSQQKSTNKPGTLFFPLDTGAPPPNLPMVPASGQFKLPDQIVSNAVPSRVRIPTIDAWNLTIQQALTSTIFLELGYVANKGTNVFPLPSSSGSQTAGYNKNQATVQGYLVPCTTSGSLPSNFGAGVCTTTTDSRKPYDGAPFGWTQPIFFFGNNANDSYHSLQAKLEKRFKQGIQFRAGYTWSKSLAYAQDYFAIDPKVNYGPSDFDRRHAFVLTSLWDLPFGKGKPLLGGTKGVLNRAVSGWSINTATFWYSGLPFTPTYSECNADVDTGFCNRPNQVGAVHVIGDRNNYFTTTTNKGLSPGMATPSNGAPCPPGEVILSNGTICATPGQPDGPWQRPAPGTFGNIGHNSFRAPGYFNTDLALVKDISLTENSSVQFRVDITNVFNRVNFGFPSGYPTSIFVDSGPVMIKTLANGATMRQFEFALKLQF